MLETLRHIVQQVNLAKDLDEALLIVVTEVKSAVATQACTIYLLDSHTQEYVMMATDGLNTDAVKKIRIGFSEGLIGLVGTREEPINLKDAPSHPKFLYSPIAGEERFRAFLGVPIIHQRRLLGVLVIQQEMQRRFDSIEEAFLITLSAQLSGVIAHAKAAGAAEYFSTDGAILTENEVLTFAGAPCVLGVGIGQALVVYPKADLFAVPDREIEDIESEIVLFEKALMATQQQIQSLRQRLTGLPSEEQALFEVYLAILDRASLGEEVIHCIRQGNWAQGALRQVIAKHVKNFADMKDAYLRERATDIKDLGRRILSYLQQQSPAYIKYPRRTVLVGDEITAADLAEVPEGHLVALVSVKGSVNSHVAILARALGIPTVMGVSGYPISKLEGKKVIVDGYYGHIYVEPPQELFEEYHTLAEEEQELDANLATLRDLPSMTPDGHKVDLYVNTGLLTDAGLIFSVGAAGVGLFRTEISFMSRENFPTEDQQQAIYRQLLSAFSPRPVIMRTLDIGGDKVLPYFPIEEMNPFLGWRGIRVTLDHPEVFLVQIRAMLRASKNLNNLKIMLPMITSVNELDDALHLIDRAYNELREEGLDIIKPPIGIMIEVPSAIYQAPELARRIDFMSVGSNDLIQYLLAVDRNNPRVSDIYEALHPAVLRALQQVICAAKAADVPVSICGEMASDPVAVILLLALGFDSLSMNANSLLRVKWVINSFRYDSAKKLLEEVLALENPAIIRLRLEQALDETGLGGLIRAGKK